MSRLKEVVLEIATKIEIASLYSHSSLKRPVFFGEGNKCKSQASVEIRSHQIRRSLAFRKLVIKWERFPLPYS